VGAGRLLGLTCGGTSTPYTAAGRDHGKRNQDEPQLWTHSSPSQTGNHAGIVRVIPILAG
jgi:hypothetical protein